MDKGVAMKERGAVSIFIVIFTALLVTVVTTSFVQIMLRNQQQATDNDLSQSAYDSAMAGVEDAKRALVQLKKCQQNPALSGCVDLVAAFGDADTDCEVLDRIGIVEFDQGEVAVGADDELNQAYTCVMIDVETESYKGKLLPDAGVVIPLVPVGGDTNGIRSVRVSWFSKQARDVADTVTTASLPLNDVRLPQSNALWSPTANQVTPPMVRAQLIQFNKNAAINLSSFDSGNARTRLLYPNQVGTVTDSFTNDPRTRSEITGNRPTQVDCEADFSRNGEYACSITVALPDMPPGETREAYLYLAGIYVQTQGFHYMVEMFNNVDGNPSGLVNFDNVQPEVDSTGRAADLFRRVKASVDVSESGVSLPYPMAALNTRNLCKEFFITSVADDYKGNGNGSDGICNP